jgi:hypothetical protein
MPLAQQTAAVSTNAALFDPTGDATTFVPLPNLLATATAADPLASRPVNTAMTPPEALAYVNQYEMGGTGAVSGVNAPIYLSFTYPVDPKSVTPATVKVFQITADSASTSATENNPLGFTDVSTLFTYQLASNGTDLQLFPNFPLLPATRYVYVVTNQVLDLATEAPVIPSIYFNYLKGSTAPSGAAAALAPVWANDVVDGQIVLSGYHKTMNDLVTASAKTTITSVDEIALIGRFITTGAGYLVTDPTTTPATILPMESAIRAFAAAGIPQTPLAAVTPSWSNAITVATTFTKNNATPQLTTQAYWTAALTALGDTAPGTVPASLGAVVLGSINSAQLALDPIAVAAAVAADPTSPTLPAVAASTFSPAYESGVVQSFRNATGQWLGFYNVPAAIDFVYLTPASSAPVGGYPLVIYQHGIGLAKETVLALAQSLTSAGFAVVAIDLPLHNSLGLPDATPTQWAEDFMAVGAPLMTRSNIQQAAFNLHRLELTVATGNFQVLGALAPSYATTPKFVGISLGSIVGAYYLAGNAQVDSTTGSFTQASVAASMKGYLSVPGGCTAYLIQNSPDFAPAVNAGLAAATPAVLPGTALYNQFFQITQSVVDPADPATETLPVMGTTISRLAGRLLVEEDTNTYSASGTMLGGDLVIPNAYTRYFGAALGGNLELEAAGVSIAPNFAQVLPGGATAPAAQFMFSLTATGSLLPDDVTAALSPAAAAPKEGYYQFNQAGIEHASLIDPSQSNPANMTLLQTQMVFFLLEGIVIDPTQASF